MAKLLALRRASSLLSRLAADSATGFAFIIEVVVPKYLVAVAEKTPACRPIFVYFEQSFGGCYLVQSLAGLVWAQKTGGPARQRDKKPT